MEIIKTQLKGGEILKEIIEQIKDFKYTSLEYTDSEDISNGIICVNDNDCIFLYVIEDEKTTIEWAVNSKESFFDGLEKTINIISKHQNIEKIYIEFIPEDYVGEMENLGFIITKEWIDFWNTNLVEISPEKQDNLIIRKIKEDEYEIASQITKSCKGYSRGFEGETYESLKEWNETENSCIFVAEKDGDIAGISCVNLYGFESEKGTILWLREVAVKPEYHSQKIGLNLVRFAINWGIGNGAVRSFLACDTENTKAIKIYEGLGYERKPGRGQINMEKVLNKK